MAFKQKAAKAPSLTAEEFVEKYNGVGYDMEELAPVACDVQGEVGVRAKALVAALKDFDAILESIEFEAG
ncbi:hypothetical protein Mx9_p24 [Myxococcus phage Mx9]|nr:hypothetical protein Mx9_p24 [Myxococcus phage Mx9]